MAQRVGIASLIYNPSVSSDGRDNFAKNVDIYLFIFWRRDRGSFYFLFTSLQFENDLPAHYPGGGGLGGMPDSMYDRSLPNHPLHQQSPMHHYPPYSTNSSMPPVNSSQDSQLKRDKDAIYG